MLCEIDCGSPQGRYPDKGPKKKKEKGKQKEVEINEKMKRKWKN